MLIESRRRPTLLFSYEMNVHPARSLQEFVGVLDRFVVPIRDRVAPGQPFGIVPHVGRALIDDLRSKKQRDALRAALYARDLFVFSINAFPLEDFHKRRVKEEVYSPPWTKVERATLTCAIADLMADLLPQGMVGTISTLGGTYRAWGDGPRDHAAIGRNYSRVVTHLAKLERDRGATIVLTAEPEPDTTFEVASDVVTLFRDNIAPHALSTIGKPLGLSKRKAEETLHRFFQVNLDVCHQSVLFRDPVREWKTLEAAGLRVGKLHVTNAIALKNPARSPAAVRELRQYREPKYLHQFAGRRRDGTIVRGSDLNRLNAQHLSECEEIRVHYHVPLSRARLDRLSTTRKETADAVAHARRHSDPPHIVIETYTWPLLAATKHATELVNGITRELRWTEALLR